LEGGTAEIPSQRYGNTFGSHGLVSVTVGQTGEWIKRGKMDGEFLNFLKKLPRRQFNPRNP
jgi:hypothetical protein